MTMENMALLKMLGNWLGEWVFGLIVVKNLIRDDLANASRWLKGSN